MRCRLEEKSPFWELLKLIGNRYNFDGEADLPTVEDAPVDTDESDREDEDPSEITGLYPTDSEDEDNVLEHKCVVCGKYFDSDFLIDKVMSVLIVICLTFTHLNSEQLLLKTITSKHLSDSTWKYVRLRHKTCYFICFPINILSIQLDMCFIRCSQVFFYLVTL